MELNILDFEGNFTKKKINFNNKNFFKKNYDHSVYLEIKRYLFSQRQGTHKSKEKSELSGSNRKLHRQKGTGGSRKGDIKNPIFRGGGRIFGPKPRKYSIKVNKKVKNIAKKYVIEHKLLKNEIKIVKNIKLKKPKTKIVLKLLNSIGFFKEKVLIINEKFDKNLYLSFRNIKRCNIININDVTCFYLLNCSYIILFENSVNKFQKLFFDVKK
ncbi:50S ribosomal protein L4 [Blattabacterium cuenoti]|uniref:50S ribosomal protein L4 n=1 Tax=Blattabacterium cuenoti TaxID=1653831 RepID=UPI00163C89B4|nr:50S ribosomal protein L4 [Blattabacterium cuenoti]